MTSTISFEAFTGILDRQFENEWGRGYLWLELRVLVVTNYADMPILKFAMEYLRKNETFCKTEIFNAYLVKVSLSLAGGETVGKTNFRGISWWDLITSSCSNCENLSSTLTQKIRTF